MLSLRAPVYVELQLADHREPLSASQWSAILSKLTPLVNEFRISGVGRFLANSSSTEAENQFFAILAELDKNRKFFHIYIDETFALAEEAWETWLDRLRRQAYFGSFVCVFPSVAQPWEAGNNETAGHSNYLRKFFIKAVETGFEVNFQSEMSAHNYEKIWAITGEAVELGANLVVWERPHQYPQSISQLQLKTALQTFDELKMSGYNVSVGGCLPNCFHDTGSYGCLGGITFAYINAQGQLLPCHHATQAAGSLLDCDLETLWQASALQEWRQALPPQCASCTRINYCPGGCRAAAIANNDGDPLLSVTPIQESEQVIQDVTLEDELCPLPLYIARPESFGWALIKGCRAIPVSHKAGSVLSLLDGKSNLADIEAQFGGVALSFIYSLYVRGFVELRSQSELPG